MKKAVVLLISSIVLAVLIFAVLQFILATVAQDGEKVSDSARHNLGEIELGQAVIASIAIETHTKEPFTATVTITGNLPDRCTELGSIKAKSSGSTFSYTVETMRPRGLACDMTTELFEQQVPLNSMRALEPGTYTIEVNGFTTTFLVD